MDSEKRSLSPFWNGPSPATAAPGTGAAAVGSALPSLKKDNFPRKQKWKSQFVAEENIKGYIVRFGELNVGLLTVTVSDCLSAKDFQILWYPFMKALRKLFPHGMWIRERQPRSGNWHAHCIVNLGRDFKTGFPFAQVEKKFYANVAPWIRELWKILRELAEKYGFGRIELLPLKHSGKACARYLTKYLSKAMGSEKAEGEEKCRLFGVWGKVRSVLPKFCLVKSRIIEKRKEWLAADSELADKSLIKQMFGPHWWHHLGETLKNVIMPVEYYQIRINGELVWDDLGRTAYEADLQEFADLSNDEDKVRESLYQFYYAQGKYIFGGETNQAHEHAMSKLGYSLKLTPPIEPQLSIDLNDPKQSKTIFAPSPTGKRTRYSSKQSTSTELEP